MIQQNTQVISDRQISLLVCMKSKFSFEVDVLLD